LALRLKSNLVVNSSALFVCSSEVENSPVHIPCVLQTVWFVGEVVTRPALM